MDDLNEYRNRAHMAENELSALRQDLRAYVRWLNDPTHGGRVIYRSDVADRLSQILDT